MPKWNTTRSLRWCGRFFFFLPKLCALAGPERLVILCNVVNASINTQKNYPDAALRFIDLSGRLVWEQQHSIEAGKQQLSIETASPAQGMYRLHLGAGGQLIAIQKMMPVK